MNILLWLLLSIISIPLLAQDIPLERFPIPSFSRGVVTRYNPALIPDDAAQWLQNIYIDENGGVKRRGGYSQFNSAVFPDLQSVRGLWSFIADDGQRYQIALSSGILYQATSNGVFTAISGMSGFSQIAEMDATSVLGKIYFTNGVDSVVSWNGASTNTVTEAPKGILIDNFRNRVVIAGKSGELSNIYMSEALDGEEWTTGPTLSGSPINISIGGLNAKPLKCLYCGYNDICWAWTEDETYAIYGFGYADFAVRQIAKEVGCIEDRTIQEKDGCLLWVSRRGQEKMCGTSIDRISDGIKDIYDTIINNTAQARTHLDTTQAHWEAGNLTVSGPGASISATISPGSITPSTWTQTDTTGADFGAGTSVDVSTTNPNYSGSLVLKGESFDDGNYTSEPVWTVLNGSCQISNGYLRDSGATACRIYTNFTQTTGYWKFDVKNTAGSFIFFMTDSISGGWFYGYFVYLGANPQLRHLSTGGTYTDLCSISEVSIVSGNWYTIEVQRDSLNNITLTVNGQSCSANNSLTTTSLYFGFQDTQGSSNDDGIDNIESNFFFQSSGTFTSQIFNTALSTPIGGPFDVTDTKPAGTEIDYFIRYSSKNVSYAIEPGVWSSLSATSDTLKVTAPKQYWQYQASLYNGGYSTQTPQIDAVSLQATTTGEYIHDCMEATGITSWGNFQANSILSGSGAISYFVSTGTSCNAVTRTTATWTAQQNNAPITISTASYLGVKDRFSIHTPTDTVILTDITANWLQGTIRPSLSSAVYNNRYYMSYTSSTISNINDFIVVYDKNDAPVFLQNMNCYSLNIFNRNLYCGDANSTGKIFQLESGTDDNGNEFTSKIRTKAYSFGNPDAEKEFVKMYGIFSPEAETILDINITPSYHLDLSTTAVTLSPVNTGEDSTAGLLISKIPFAMANNVTGRFIDVEFVNTGKNQAWSLFGLSIFYRMLDVK